MFKYHLACLRRALRFAEHGLALLDRNWISEEVYAQFYRNGTKWPHQGRIVQKLFLKHGVMTVLCLLDEQQASEQVEKHRVAGTYHSPQFLTRPADIAKRYRQLYYGAQVNEPNTYVEDITSQHGFIQRSDCLGYRFNIEGAEIDKFIDTLLSRLQAYRASQYQPALEFNTRNIAGHLATAKYLMVGDTVNYNDYKKCWPFMSYTGSTLFMAEVMHDLKLKEEEFMWTNADCPEQHVQQIVAAKPSIRIIALGNTAAKAVSGLPHVLVPHPSYGRRFMGADKWATELQYAVS